MNFTASKGKKRGRENPLKGKGKAEEN